MNPSSEKTMATIISILRDISLNVKAARLIALQTARRAQAVKIIEQKHGPWSGSNYLGNYVDIEGNTDLKKSVLKMPEWGMPEMWTIMLGLDLTNVNFTGSVTSFGLIATISAGAGGTTQELEVDWVNGTMLSVPMNALSVGVSYDQFFPGFPANYGTIRTRVTLARGLRPGGIPPIRTLHTEATLPDNTFSTQQSIPSFARKVALYTRDNQQNILYDPSNRVEFIGSPTTGLLLETVPMSFQQYCLPEGFMIPEGAYFVRMFNGSGTEMTEPFWRFSLGV
jgi:hypothetical protein